MIRIFWCRYIFSFTHCDLLCTSPRCLLRFLLLMRCFVDSKQECLSKRFIPSSNTSEKKFYSPNTIHTDIKLGYSPSGGQKRMYIKCHIWPLHRLSEEITAKIIAERKVTLPRSATIRHSKDWKQSDRAQVSWLFLVTKLTHELWVFRPQKQPNVLETIPAVVVSLWRDKNDSHVPPFLLGSPAPAKGI